MKRKIILSLSALFLFFSSGVILSVLYITRTTDELNYIIELHQVEQLRRSLIISIQNVQSNLYAYETPFQQDLDAIVVNVEDLENSAKTCTSCHHAPRINTRIVRMQSHLQDYLGHLSFYITMSANRERINSIKGEAVRLGNTIIYETQRMSHSASVGLERLTSESMKKIREVKTILFATIIISYLFGILIAWYLAISVTGPITKLVEATRKISTGDLETRIHLSDSTEFGELSKNFNVMSASLKERNEKLEQQRQELTERVKELEKFYEMSVGRELRMKQLKKEMKELRSELSKYRE